MSAKPIVVVGDGWAALGAVGLLVSSGLEVRWISGSGARISPPLASLEWGTGVLVLKELAAKLGIECGEHHEGSFLREYRNKAFREPAWCKAPTPQARLEVKDELLWDPERRWVGAFDSQFEISFRDLEEEIRKKLKPENYSNLKRIEEIPVLGFKVEDGQVLAIKLGSGAEVECAQVIYADRWSLLIGMEGLPKFMPFLRNREPMGVLQANFVHSVKLGEGVKESFFSPLPRESGDKIERYVWGYFSAEKKRSTWSICLSSEEVENNHEIAKKFRRLKSTLDKTFSAAGFLPEGVSSLSSTIVEEQVRLAEEMVFAGDLPKTLVQESPEVAGIVFLTDGFGPSRAFEQVGLALGIETRRLDAETEDMNPLNTTTL